MRLRFLQSLWLVAALLLAGPPAWAGAVLTSGNVLLGVDDFGQLIIFDGRRSDFVGVTFVGVGDALVPGCFCEGWGVSGNGQVGMVSNNSFTFTIPNFNVTLVSFSSTPTTAISVTQLTSLPDLEITHAYGPSISPALFQGVVTIRNNSSTTITDVRYTRALDWDVPPTPFSEFVTIQRGGSTALLFSNDNGFADPDPLVNPPDVVFGTSNTDFVDSGRADHGAFFTFGFGDLAPFSSISFNIFYGAAADEASALAALAAVGAQVYTLGQQFGDPTGGTPATFIFAFSQGGVDPIPEPASVVLFASVAALVAWRLRSQKRTSPPARIA
ncbi:MAG: hypothetical protein NZV14_08795 [Bryobacteraceae bacterium]|nr:hypothetical protein [Bryobacteraceae bacterium]MDW8378246.1 hypothetical protein [Bryobacterales bacterium]